jgi:aldose 1-epimerase
MGQREIEAFTLSNSRGISVRILTLGATIQSLVSPDRMGNLGDIALGYDSAREYLEDQHYLGATIGRYANRIAFGRFLLEGTNHQLATNDGIHAVHGGPSGFSRRVWTAATRKSGASAGVTLTLASPDGDGGYPGALSVTAAFELKGDQLAVRYRADTDAPTIINLTNHIYFNLDCRGAGAGVERHLLTIPAESFLPLDPYHIPTGEIRAVEGTAFDFREPKPVGRDLRGRDEQISLAKGYDHCWVLSRSRTRDPRLVARLHEPNSGRVVELLSTQPGLQLYTGNYFDGGKTGKLGRRYRPADGLALEPQLFPDTPNRPEFGSARLLPGETYEHQIIYRLSTD